MRTPLRWSAFTLIELLVAVSITAGLVALMLIVTRGTLKVWQRSQDRFGTNTEALVVLNHLQSDLQSAVLRPDAGSLAADVINTPALLTNHGWLIAPLMKPATSVSAHYLGAGGSAAPSIATARFGLSGTWLRFFTTNTETNGSLPVAVAYQIVRRPISGTVSSTNPSDVRYALFRSAVAADLSFATGTDVRANGYGSTSPNPSVQRSAPTLTNPNTTGDVIAANVVDFGIWLYRRDGNGVLQRIFPSSDGDAAHVALADSSIPDVADIMVRLLTDTGAKQIEALEAGKLSARPSNYPTDAEWWWGIVDANSEVITRRVSIVARSL